MSKINVLDMHPNDIVPFLLQSKGLKEKVLDWKKESMSNVYKEFLLCVGAISKYNFGEMEKPFPVGKTDSYPQTYEHVEKVLENFYWFREEITISSILSQCFDTMADIYESYETFRMSEYEKATELMYRENLYNLLKHFYANLQKEMQDAYLMLDSLYIISISDFYEYVRQNEIAFYVDTATDKIIEMATIEY